MLKLSKQLFFISCVFLFSCTKTGNKAVVIKAGERIWTVKEVKNYFHFRVNKDFLEGQKKPEQLKKELLSELLLISIVENWAKKNQIQIKKSFLTEEEKKIFSKYSSRGKALKEHKNYLSLYNFLLQELSKKIDTPPLSQQKNFYNKNKQKFIEPASCHLKQVLVKQEKFAQSLLKRLKQGESFDTLNQAHSLKKNPGWVNRGDLEVFDRACQNPTRSLSPILKSPYGYHIFFVGGKKPSQKKSFKSVQKQIIQILKEKGLKEQFKNWLKEEMPKSHIFINKKLLDKIHIQYKTNPI